jgi:hypothetical protein
MTGPAVLELPKKQAPDPFSPEAFDAQQPSGITRGLSPEEFDQAQGMTPTQLKGWRLPGIPAAPRDVTRTPNDQTTKGTPLKPFDIHDPTTYANPVLRQLVLPALEHPVATAAMLGAPVGAAAISPLVGLAAGTAIVGDMVSNIAQYGYQQVLASKMSPDVRREFEADPERFQGEAAAMQAIMLGAAPLVHVAVKARSAYLANLPMEITPNAARMAASGLTPSRSYHEPVSYGPHVEMTDVRRALMRGPSEPLQPFPGLDPGTIKHPLPHDLGDMTIPVNTNRFAAELEQGAATTRVPQDVPKPEGFQPTATVARLTTTPRKPEGLVVPETTTPGKVKPVETAPASASLQAAADVNASVRDYHAERLAQDQADVSAARTADAEKIAKADAMRPRRRVTNYFESPQGAEVLGTLAGRHGLPETASPYHPESPLDGLWKEGHAAATESYPNGFSMGGALTDNRIPGAGEVPPAARGANAPEGLRGNRPFGVIGERAPRPPEGATSETAALAAALKPSPYRGHTVDELASAAVDAQTAIERAQGRVVDSQTADHVAWNDPEAIPEHIFYEDRGRTASDVPSATSEKVLARAKSQLAQIERELAMRGYSGDKVAELMQGAKEQAAERAGMQSDQSLASHMGAEDPFADPTAPAERGLAPVEGTGPAQTRGLSAGVERKALVNKLATTVGDLPEYKTVSMADQASRAADLIASDPALARRVALGEANAPDGVLPESVFVAVENKAIAEGDVATIRDLATGKLTGEATTMGQRIRTLGERDPDSPVGAIKNVIEVRMKGVKDVPRATAETVDLIRAQLAKAKIKPEAWADFVNSLRC